MTRSLIPSLFTLKKAVVRRPEQKGESKALKGNHGDPVIKEDLLQHFGAFFEDL